MQYPKLNRKTKYKKIYYKEAIVSILVCILSFFASLMYTNGDQARYIAVYEKMPEMDIRQAFQFYSQLLSSKEILHFAITWCSSVIGFNKFIVMSIANLLLAFTFLVFLSQRKISLIVSSIIVLTNFYFYALYFSAERLKFAFILFFCAGLAVQKSRRFLTLAGLAILSHIQIIALYISYACVWGSNLLFQKSNNKYNNKTIITIIALFIIMLGGGYLLRDQLITKFSSYYGITGFSIYGIVKTSGFMFISMVYSKKISQPFFAFLPIICVALIFGDSRVNIMGYFIFLYFVLPVKSGWNLGVLISSCYFAFKSYVFILSVIKYGDGYIIK